jgi:hypothetical protein
MKLLIKVSTWAKRNPWTARILIVSSHLLLTIFAILLGFILTNLGISIPEYTFLSACLIFSIGLIIYPLKAEKGSRCSKIQFYQRQKMADLMLAGATFIMVLQLANGYFTNEIKPVERIWNITAQACYVKVTQTEAVAPAIENPTEKQIEKKHNKQERKKKFSAIKHSKIAISNKQAYRRWEGRPWHPIDHWITWAAFPCRRPGMQPLLQWSRRCCGNGRHIGWCRHHISDAEGV